MDEQLTQPEDFTDRFNFTTLDRRRGGRASHALILKGAEFLPAPDRALLKAVFQDGRSAAELARLNPHIKPRALSYRVRLLARRTLSPEFAFVTAHRRRWGRTRRKVATACFLHGLSIREAARLARVSFHAARQHHAAVVELMQSGGTTRPGVVLLDTEARLQGGPCHQECEESHVMGGAA